MPRLFLVLATFFFVGKLAAQEDNFTGTWTATPNLQGANNVMIQLQIGASEKMLLYPASLRIQTEGYLGAFELLLVRKNSREMVVSKNKFARVEFPRIFGNNTYMLNGLFDRSRDLKRNFTLTLNAIPLDKPKVQLPDTNRLEEAEKKIALAFARFFSEGEMVFSKTNENPWEGEYYDRVLSPSSSPIYFGLQDTLSLKQRDGKVSITSDKKNSTDIVSVQLNGRMLLDRVPATRKKREEEILLDTGLNILVFYAENFGNSLANRGKAVFEFGRRKFILDFTDRADSAAGFIVIKAYVSTDEMEEKFISGYSGGGYPPVKDDEKLISSLSTKSREIVFAVWDDAVEDGDTISISVNGKWIVKGFPVLSRPQFIPVKLNEGRNSILFIGDNLGSIPPNTSVLEIIDGKRRKAYRIETLIGEKNLLRIFYDN